MLQDLLLKRQFPPLGKGFWKVFWTYFCLFLAYGIILKKVKEKYSTIESEVVKTNYTQWNPNFNFLPYSNDSGDFLKPIKLHSIFPQVFACFFL
jgi:hypothetical protein